VYDASGGNIATDERRAQRDFVCSDLDLGATLYAPMSGDEEVRRLYLVTQRLVYPMRALPKDGNETWDIAVCNKPEMRTGELPFGGRRFQPYELDIAIDIATSEREAEALRDTVGRTSLSWEALAGTPVDEVVDDYVQVRSALHLIEVVGAVIKSLDILPVEVLRQGIDGQGQVVVRAPTAIGTFSRERLGRVARTGRYSISSRTRTATAACAGGSASGRNWAPRVLLTSASAMLGRRRSTGSTDIASISTALCHKPHSSICGPSRSSALNSKSNAGCATSKR
jgi:hypothetical protein